jgi:hypothetical protein
MRRLVIAALSAAAVAPMAAAVVAPPAVNTACADGETGVTNGCAPFCLPGKYFDYEHTGLCLPVPPPPPNGVVPQVVSR